ncbi:FixH family protein [Hyphomonas sp.]|uniref:FixH family protein n=2 Tax=Hyphomonas sp. TaxID=87 RepID=UPI0032EBC3D5
MMSVVPPTLSITPKQLKGRHVLVWMLGFFGLMFVVNGIFLWAAITSFPGEHVKHSYLQGLQYNKTIESRSYQQNMMWTAEVGLVETDAGQILVARLFDGDGNPLPARAVKGELRRAATQESDLGLELTPVGAGEFQGTLPVLASGAWHVTINADVTGEGEIGSFTAAKVLTVQ